MGYIIVLIICILFTVFCFYMVGVTSKARKITKEKQREDKSNGITRVGGIRCVAGLNVPDNSMADIVIDKEKLHINVAGNEFIMKLSQITNVDFQVNVDVQQYLESSVMKGIVGAATFGVAGAVIGSAPKTKERKEITGYAIITYQTSNLEYVSILLKDDAANVNYCLTLVNKLKPLINTRVNKVEL